MRQLISRPRWAALLICISTASPQQFEIAAVKPHAPAAACGESNTYPGGRLVLSCFTLYEIVREALDLQPGQSDELTGGPDWSRTEAWDVTAKAAGVAGELPPVTYRSMLLKLAEREFALQLRSEKRQVKGFRLVVDRKTKPRTGLHPNSGDPWRFDLKPGFSLTAQRVSMNDFAAWLKMPMGVGERVVDHTGLPGEYDFVLQWAPNDIRRTAESQPSGDAPGIFTALHEQLGLKLQPARVPADGYIIEAANRPRK